jgi:hypothetical protein
MDRLPSDPGKPESAHMHQALQEALRTPDTFAAGWRAAASSGVLKRLLAAVSARAIHFFASRQVEHNVAVVRALEAVVRAIDERDRAIEAASAHQSAAEERVRQLEVELRTVREAEEDARRKLALIGIRLREIDPRSRAAEPDPERR